MLLFTKRVKSRNRTDGSVIFQTRGNLLSEIVTNLNVWRELKPALYIRPLKSALKRRIERQVPTLYLLVDDRTELQGPGIGRILASLITNLRGKAQSHGQVPFFRGADSRTNVTSDPMPAVTGAGACEDV